MVVMMAQVMLYLLAPLLLAQDPAELDVSAQRSTATQPELASASGEEPSDPIVTGYSGHFACRTFSGIDRQLAAAASDVEPELLAECLRDGGDVNARSNSTRRLSLLQTAVWHDWGLESVRLLLDAGADIDARDQLGETALAIACQDVLGPDHQVVSLLIERGADVNAAGSKGRTPLMYAALCDKGSHVVELLLESSADVAARDKMGWTALMHACRRRQQNIEVVRTLLRAGAVVNDSHRQGGTALSIAAYYGQREVVALLIKSGAKVNTSDAAQWTPLICSAVNGHAGIVDLLIRSGANVHAADRLGRTALPMARMNRHRDVERRLLEAGARF